MKLARVAIDTGDGENTMEVYRWARRHPGFVMAVKGRESIAAQQAIGSPSWQDVSVGGKKIKRGVRLWNVGTSMLKMELFGQLGMDKPVDGEEYPPGFVYLPDGMSDELVKQLVAEELRMIRLRSGGFRREWHKIRDRNEALDNAVYARAVAISLGVDRWTAAQWAKTRGDYQKPGPVTEKAPAQLVAATSTSARGARQRRPNPYTSRGR
jgi:phage terminase large subunit GpA-like protein